ncbi:hypothetical protein [Mucilaginibacter sp. SP1R1]|uniref:hypothetical protein n=1 Tax=Mucilaginibacter sp. SP1R1 TaxID=2723091 RepID=UPI00160C5688|nr:hypothetical protein [Mucilaginibacter sp. SP1R1]MBB6151018.1 hypothetical protein [Mucilaginibacter sp. SP1R1]
MKKQLLFVLLIVVCLGCSKKNRQTAPCNPGMCTMIFTTIGIHFVDQAGKDVTVKDFTAINMRTNRSVKSEPLNGSASGGHVIATDGNMKEFTNDGDDVKVTVTNVATNQTKSVVVKIAGGCACHVSKVSGPDTVVFD